MTNWTAEQRKNANQIIQVGKEMGMSWRDIQTGLAVAMQESGLRNLNYGDRDSLGLFQQRPSMGWGTAAQVTSPQYAAHKFFKALMGVKNRNSMSLTQAAQAVQRSGFPNAYAKWAGPALDLVSDARKNGLKIAGTDTVSTTGGTFKAGGADLGAGSFSGGASDTGTTADPLAAMGTGSATSALAATTDNMSGMAPGLGAATAGASYPQSAATDVLPPTDLPTFSSGQDYQAGFSSAGATVPFQKGVDNTHSGVVQYAKQFVGTPYVWGGTNLNSGVDCSGFVQAVYKHFGVNLPRVSYQQANSGTRIGLKQLRPGDLVAWDLNGRNNGADHIAIYAGNGKIVEAPRPGVGVRVRKLGSNEGAWGVRLHKN